MLRTLVIFFTLLQISISAQAEEAPYAGPAIEQHLEAYLDYSNRIQAETTAGVPAHAQLDLARYQDTLAEVIAGLDASAYNDVIAHVVSDYVHNPSHRRDLMTILLKTRARAWQEISADPSREAFYELINTVFNVWITYGVFKFGRGLWNSRALGLRGIPAFIAAARRVAHAGRLTREAALLVSVVGGSLGVTEAVIEYCATRKLDPLSILFAAQQRLVVIYKLSLERVNVRLQTETSLSLTQLLELGTEVTNITLELEAMKAQSPDLQLEINPLSLIVLEFSQLVEQRLNAL